MGKMSEKFIMSRWIPFICNVDMIQEELPNMCVCNVTILVLKCVMS
jgi:hypothetical protein